MRFVTCYTRHLKDVFDEAGVDFTEENRRRADRHFKKWLGKTNCPETWKELKKRLSDPADREEVIKSLRVAFASA